VLGAQLGVDAIQEFSVLTANYTAEYGRTSGGVINAVMKSGTNSFHGDVYWFLRDKKLDARNFFDTTLPPFHRNQWGGSAGGPIKKDRTFIFGDFEAIRQDKSFSNISTVPSVAARNGILCSLCATPDVLKNDPVSINDPNGVDPATGIDKVILPYLGLYPAPAGSFGNGDMGHFASSPLQHYTENYATFRVDHKISDKDSLSAVYFFDRSLETIPDPFLLSTTGTLSQRQMGSLEETHTFGPTLVNIVRLGYSRTQGNVGEPGTALNPLAKSTSLGVGGGRFPPQLIIQGGFTNEIGGFDAGPNLTTLNSTQAYDDAFLTRGAHSIKFGGAFEHLQESEFSTSSLNGVFFFNDSATASGLKNFLSNQPTKLSPLGDAKLGHPVGTRISSFGAYVQDDWRFRPNLTINAGLRYEPATQLSEAHNGFVIIQNLYGGARVNVKHVYQTNPTLRNFEPRVGFAWDPFHNGKTSVRAGFGIFDALPGPWYESHVLTNSYPFACTVSGNLTSNPYSFAVQAANIILGNGCNVNNTTAYTPDQNPKSNYSMNWNLNVQREITPTLMAMVGYVGSHTLHSPYTSDQSNYVPPVTFGSDYWPVSGGKIFNSNAGQIRPTWWAVSSHYGGLLAQVTKKMSHGLQVQGSFTWGKCISDGGESAGNGDQYLNSFSTLLFFDKSARHGLCDFDITRNFVANYIWQVPSPKFGGAVGEHILGGWQLGGIITVSTGVPTTVFIGGDPLGLINNDAVDYPDHVPGCDPVNHNYKKDPSGLLAYINLNCFIPPVAPASIASDPTKCVAYPNPVTTSGVLIPNTCQQLFGNAGRNTVKGPGLTAVDFSIFKNNYVKRISETFNVQFRAEFFNILNHANFIVPTFEIITGAGTPEPAANGGTTGGVINSTGTNDPRQIQLSLKIIW
jgi:hypothetical protein